jgi:hypothetical protein
MPLDQEKCPFLNFIGAIDRQIKSRRLGKVGDRNSQPQRLLMRRLRSSNGLDLQAGRDTPADFLNHQRRGRPRTQADRHAIFHLRSRPNRRLALRRFRRIVLRALTHS